jgi:hypothetical protein
MLVIVAVAVAAALLLALGALLVRRVRVHAQVKAMVDAEGAWRAAGGGAVGPIAFTAGVSPSGAAWTAHALGRTIARGTRVPGGVGAGASAARRRLGGARAFALARAALRRVRFDRVDATVRGAADDPATSARVMGLVTAASAAFAPRANVATHVDWLADAPFVDVDCDLEASFVPLVLGWDVARAALVKSPARSASGPLGRRSR